ncbi:hypothetical protein [Streptomyces sp. NPDC001999]
MGVDAGRHADVGVPRHGELSELRGNYLLNKTMGVETHVIIVSGNE